MSADDHSQSPDFEASLERLENLVARLEAGDLSLEESLRTFEEGVRLTRDCQQRLTQAEQKVRLLLEEDAEGEARAVPFDTESS